MKIIAKVKELPQSVKLRISNLQYTGVYDTPKERKSILEAINHLQDKDLKEYFDLMCAEIDHGYRGVGPHIN